jgi:hypothetical protein
LEQLTHALKGSGGTAGYKDLTVAAENVIQAVRLRDKSLVPQRLNQLRHTIERAIAGRPSA